MEACQRGANPTDTIPRLVAQRAGNSQKKPRRSGAKSHEGRRKRRRKRGPHRYNIQKRLHSARGTGSAHRNATCGLCIRLFLNPCKVTDRRTTPARPDSRMSTFLNFLSAAADFALTLNLKVAIVAAGFIVLLVLTR